MAKLAAAFHRKDVWAALLGRLTWLANKAAAGTADSAHHLPDDVQRQIDQLSPSGWLHFLFVLRALWRAHLPPVQSSLLSMPSVSLSMLTQLDYDAVSPQHMTGALELVQPVRLLYLSKWAEQFGGGTHGVRGVLSATFDLLSTAAAGPTDPRTIKSVEHTIRQFRPRGLALSSPAWALIPKLLMQPHADRQATAEEREVQQRVHKWTCLTAAGALEHAGKKGRTRLADSFEWPLLVSAAAQATVLEQSDGVCAENALERSAHVHYYIRPIDPVTAPISLVQQRAVRAMDFLRWFTELALVVVLDSSSPLAAAWTTLLLQQIAPVCAAFLLQLLDPKHVIAADVAAPRPQKTGLLASAAALAKSVGSSDADLLRLSSPLLHACSDATDCVNALLGWSPARALYKSHNVLARLGHIAPTVHDAELRAKLMALA
jgi:hypothetical protein